MPLANFTSIIIWLAALATIFQGSAARAESITTSAHSAPWNTSTHVGFAINDTSSTGFKLTGGTMVMLDASRPFGSRFELGLRTIASGAQSKLLQFYRLGAGPLVTYHLNSNWQLQAAITSFNETGLTNTAERSYRSRGQQTFIGWERVWRFDRRIEAALGGFVAVHTGSLAPAAQIPIGQSPNATHQPLRGTNQGISHGAEAALRLSL